MSHKNSIGNKQKVTKLYNIVGSDYLYCPFCYFDEDKNRIIYRPLSKKSNMPSYWKKYTNKKLRKLDTTNLSRAGHKKLVDMKYKLY